MKKFLLVFSICIVFLIPKDVKGFSLQLVTKEKTGTINLSNYNKWMGNIYTYSSNGNDAFCLDPNLQLGDVLKPFDPALEGTHSKNLYQFQEETADKTFTSDMIRIGQNYADNLGLNNRNGGNNYYVDMLTALRWAWLHSGHGVDCNTGYAGHDKGFCNTFKANGSKLINGAAELYTNPYGDVGDKTEKADGFVYGNGFWEARYKQVDEEHYPGLKQDENGKWSLDIMYKTNIRCQANNGKCENFNIPYNPDYYEVEVLEVADKLISNKGVAYIHIKNTGEIDGNGQEFWIGYTDPREASNFWVTYQQGTEGMYAGDEYGGRQRMYIIEQNSGSITINTNGTGESESTIIPPTETKGNSYYCKPKIKSSPCTGEYEIYDDPECVFEENNNHINEWGYDKEDESDTRQYTTHANKYCNISCVEDIKFTFPKENFGNESIAKAGTYYTLKPTEITSTGTRTCRATLAMGEFESTVSNPLSSDSEIPNVLNKIININNVRGIVSVTLNSSTDEYSYKQQNYALNSLYSSIPDILTGTSVGSCGTAEDPAILYQATYSNYGYNFTSNTKCGTDMFYSSELYSSDSSISGLRLNKFKGFIRDFTNSTANLIETELKKLNDCTSHFDNNFLDDSYNFAPDIKFGYYEQYNKFFLDQLFKKGDPQIDYSDSSATYREYFEQGTLEYDTYNSSSGRVQHKKNTEEYELISGTDSNRYIQTKVTKKYNSYRSPITFFAAIPNGEAVIKSIFGNNYTNYNGNVISGSNFQKLTTDEYDVYPIALSQNEDTTENNDNYPYSYSYTISSLGDYDILSSNPDVGRMDRLVAEPDRTYYCTYEVKNDVTTPNKPNFFYRNISLNKFNPNNRNLGKNWADTNAKAKATLEEINAEGTDEDPEGIYGKTPEYSFTLTPTNMQDIRTYNKEQEENNGKGYADFNMTKVNENGESSEDGIWYKSSFIRDNSYFKEIKVNNNWTRWTEDVAKLSGIGPAWK